jgi:hypothetical protein
MDIYHFFFFLPTVNPAEVQEMAPPLSIVRSPQELRQAHPTRYGQATHGLREREMYHQVSICFPKPLEA